MRRDRRRGARRRQASDRDRERRQNSAHTLIRELEDVTLRVEGAEDLLVRVHSECLTGDVFGSRRCDCGAQKEQALAMIAAEGRGALIYLRQEGRGIGLADERVSVVGEAHRKAQVFALDRPAALRCRRCRRMRWSSIGR